MEKSINKIGVAAKWSSITEIIAKLITPISNMILARLLTPEAFGVVATVTMIFSFADMFTDSGFQKFLVQHEFENEVEKEKSINVAFWTNLILSFIIWIVISVFSEDIAILVGNPGLGNVFRVACISLPLTSFSSIQMALYQREFDFKTLFSVRMVGISIPLFVTVPLALITHSYWALVIGTICGNFSNAIILTIKSNWKPKLYYDFKILFKMFSFSFWSLIESITIWLTNYIGIFIVGAYLSSYYLGLYKTSMNTVNQILNLITAATSTVLFSALSRAQDDNKKFNQTFFQFQRSVALLILPMGVGIFIFRDLITSILLGNQWSEAAGFIGLWGLINSIKVILSNYCSEAYRAKGIPKVSVFVQASQLLFLIPVLIFGAQKGFETLYILRCLVSIELIIVNLVVITVTIKISALKMIENVIPEIIGSILMGGLAIILLKINDGIIWQMISVVICALFYFGVIFFIPKSRRQFLPFFKKETRKIINKFKYIA